jgi:hypothetical protein
MSEGARIDLSVSAAGSTRERVGLPPGSPARTVAPADAVIARSAPIRSGMTIPGLPRATQWRLSLVWLVADSGSAMRVHLWTVTATLLLVLVDNVAFPR